MKYIDSFSKITGVSFSILYLNFSGYDNSDFENMKG